MLFFYYFCFGLRIFRLFFFFFQAEDGIRDIGVTGVQTCALDFLGLVKGAALVVTDSGGIQEETTVLGVPCLTVRPNTERPITITHGTNRLVEPEGVVALARSIVANGLEVPPEGPPLWDGHAGERIADILVPWLAARATG